VALGSSTTKRLALDNTGDAGTKFSWDLRGLGQHFSISPAEGFLVRFEHYNSHEHEMFTNKKRQNRVMVPFNLLYLFCQQLMYVLM
jgi:hypothetical protein